MKKVFSSNSEAIHIFANDPNREGRASSISFNNGILFSYNTAIAQHVINAKGESAIIINNRNYSVSTSKHQSQLRYAANHLNRIYIDFVGYNVQRLEPDEWRGLSIKPLIEHYESAAAANLAKASRARKNADHYRAAAFNGLKELKTYFAFFGIEYEAGDLSELEAAAIENDKKERERAKARKIEKMKEQAEKLAEWREGANLGWLNFEVTALRIKNDEIETSRGAKIPLDHAIKVWPLLSRIANSDESFRPSNHAIHLGNYRLTYADNQHLIVGCHDIPMSEVKNIAKQLNLQGA